MKFLKVLVPALVALAAFVISATYSIAAPLQPTLAEERALTGDGQYKLPKVTTGNNRVHLSWGAPNQTIYAERAPEGGDFALTELGSVGRNSTYFNTGVAVSDDGTVHFVWSEDGVTVYHRSKAPGQSWSNPHVVAGGQDFATAVTITTQGSNVFVVWSRNRSASEGELAVARSTDRGNSWSGAQTVALPNGVYAGRSDLATGPDGNVYLAWTGTGDGQAYVGQWDGNNFRPSRITNGPDKFFFPAIAVAPNGQVFVGLGNETGVYYAARQNDGSYPLTRIFATEAVRTPVAVAFDALGSLHLAWSSQQGKDWNVWYAVKARGDADASTPIIVSRDPTGFKANVDIAVSIGSGTTSAHIVWESYTDGQRLRYARVTTPSGVPPVPAPTPPPAAPAPNVPATGTFDFADGAFRDLWTRTDSLVQANAVSYSWIWGPQPFTGEVYEPYAQSPGGGRRVQYFDKSRMEINQPGAARNQFYVSNGRLADELITGQLQVGDAQYEQRQPAAIAVVGDVTNTFPLYRDLQAVYRTARNTSRANLIISRAADGGVKIDILAEAERDPSMVIAQRINGLGVPAIFWNYMNQPGQVTEGGRVRVAQPLFDWRYVIGEPLTEAYWTTVTVGGKQQGVLVQAFERRILTYTPTNPSAYQVEMGNIGRHYFEWRYGVRPR